MSPVTPSGLTYGTIIGQFKTIEIDSVDADALPEHYPMRGTVKFTASASYLQFVSSVTGEAVGFHKTEFTAILDSEGYLSSGVSTNPVGPPDRGLTVLASDNPDIQPKNWTWIVTLNLESSSGAPVINRPPFPIEVVGGQELDLVKAIPVPSSPGIGIPAMESAVLRAEEAASKVAFFAGDTNPQMTQPGLWLQTGLGDGSDFTLWIEDGQ